MYIFVSIFIDRFNKEYRKFVGNLFYLYYKYAKNNQSLAVFSIDETVEKIISDNCSVIRYGDGEMAIMRGKNIKFQAHDDMLRNALITYAKIDKHNLLICIPDVFHSLDVYTKKSKQFWKTNLVKSRMYWERYFDIQRKYYNAFLSRPYISYADKSHLINRFDKIRSIWSGRRVLLIEGSSTRNGVVSGLFDNTQQIERIICPSSNAFTVIDEIIEYAKSFSKNHLVLVTLGPAAKIVVFELYCAGYQALDIGQIDTEYKWYLSRSEEKCVVPDSIIITSRGYTLNKHELEREYNSQIAFKIETKC